MRSVLLVLRYIGTAAWVFGSILCLGVVFFVRPLPDWVIPAFFASGGVFVATGLLYLLLNALSGYPDDASHWELQTPTTVASLLKQSPIGTFFAWAALTTLGLVAFQTLDLQDAITVPVGLLVGTAVWWLVMLGFAKGWILDE